MIDKTERVLYTRTSIFLYTVSKILTTSGNKFKPPAFLSTLGLLTCGGVAAALAMASAAVVGGGFIPLLVAIPVAELVPRTHVGTQELLPRLSRLLLADGAAEVPATATSVVDDR